MSKGPTLCRNASVELAAIPYARTVVTEVVGMCTNLDA